MSQCSIIVSAPDDPDRAQCISRLEDAGYPIPAFLRAEFQSYLKSDPLTLFLALSGEGSCLGGVGLTRHPISGVPGVVSLRMESLGSSCDTSALTQLVAAGIESAKSDARVVRLDAHVLSNDRKKNAIAQTVLADKKFVPGPVNGYARTLVVDLTSPVDDILANLHRSARRNVRQVDKYPIRVDTIRDPALLPRVETLLRSAMERTGGKYEPVDWQGRLRFAEAFPHLARLVGLFRGDKALPDGLVAIAWGWHHGDHGVYSDAASEHQDDIRLPLSYPLVWDLITWAKSHGATWFDLGGVTTGSMDDEEDPLGGISDFKRFFSRDLLEITEWSWYPRTVQAHAVRLARAIKGRVVTAG